MRAPRKVILEEKRVMVEWSDGQKSFFTNKNLREACPCAECAGESLPLGGRATIPLVIALPDDIKANSFSMVGLYAIAFVWSDGHDSGIYTYDLLLELCECDVCVKNPKVG